jgi:phosphatidylinositol glycan class B
MFNQFQWTHRNLLLIGLTVYGIAAWFSEGYYHPDEHFQILEFADYKLGITPAADLPWEFAKQIRPGLQPMLAYGMLRLYHWLGMKDPFIGVFFMRLIMAALSVLLFSRLSRLLKDDFIRPASALILSGLTVFLWFMPYLSVRFSSENTGSLAFLAGLGLLLEMDHNPAKMLRWRWLAMGLCFGLSFYFRFQMAFAVAGVLAWLVLQRRVGLHQITLLALGGLAGAIIGMGADYWLYQAWVWTPWNYFHANIVEDISSHFGVSPWWGYFPEFISRALPPISLVLLGLMGLGIYKQPRHLLTWVFVSFVLAHFLVKHKEMRFLFPMAFPMLFLVTTGWEAFYAQVRASRPWRVFLRLTLGINAVFLMLGCTQPVQECIPFFRYFYHATEQHPVTLYVEKESPYYLVMLNVHYYEAPNLEINVVQHLSDLGDTTRYHVQPGDLLLNKRLGLDSMGGGLKTRRVFTYIPDWILKYNVNHWQERSRIWSIWKVE